MKHVQTCLKAREDRDSSFDHFGSAVRLGARLFMCGEHLLTPF